MKILVVNLTRFGDLLQTSPTLFGLRRAHPDAHVTLCVDRNFAEVARGLPGVDRVWEIDLDSLGRLLLVPEATGLRQAYRFAEELVRALRAEAFDLALNFSSSRMSAVLMGLLAVPDTRGWTMTPDGHRRIAHRWSRLFATNALHRHLAPFNLVDYYQRVAGLGRGPERLFFAVPAAARARASALLADARLGEPLVALQLGASRAARRWPAAHFIALARALGTRIGARVLLCGAAGDRPIAREVAGALGTQAIDACGATTIAELGGLLERTDLLLTGDTGPMHLAVAVGTPVVGLFFGPALPFDTGPYAADHVCLHAAVPCAPCEHSVTCGEPFCRDTIAAEAVAEAVIARRAGDWDALGAAADRWPEVRWYRTRFDVDGLFDLELLGSRLPVPRERLRRAYRALWKTVLDGTPPERSGGALPRDAATAHELARHAAAAAGLAREIEAMAREVTSLDLDRLEAIARRLEDADAALVRFAAIHDAVAPLVQMFRFEKENLVGEDVIALATATRELHERLAAEAGLLGTLLEAPAASGRGAEEGSFTAPA